MQHNDHNLPATKTTPNKIIYICSIQGGVIVAEVGFYQIKSIQNIKK